MIYGIGIDLVEIYRIKMIIERNGDRLAKRILTDLELQVYHNKINPIYFLAKRFAAKEAAVKAFGVGINKGLCFSHFEILNDNLGKPILRLFANAANLARKLFIFNMHVTITDDKYYAYAMVIFERNAKYV